MTAFPRIIHKQRDPYPPRPWKLKFLLIALAFSLWTWLCFEAGVRHEREHAFTRLVEDRQP